MPPWIVNFGAIIVAKRIRSSNSVLLPGPDRQTPRACALLPVDLVPIGSRSLTREPSTVGSFRPAASRSPGQTCGMAVDLCDEASIPSAPRVSGASPRTSTSSGKI